MNEWKTVRLGDVATYINGYAFKPSDWGTTGLPIIRIQNLTGNDYETNFFNGEIHPKYTVKDGDVLISWSASLGVYEWNKGKALLNQHIFKVVFDKIEVDKKYFIFTVSHLLNEMVKHTHGSTMRHITKPDFDNMPFPLPSIKEQKKISELLEKCTSIIATNKQMLEKYDTLIKSRFIEMFGDPATNPKKWEIKILDEVCKKITDGKHGGCKVEDNSDYYYVGAREIFDLNIHYETAQEITKEDFEKDYKRCNLEIGDFCIVNTGATIGKTAIAKDVRTTKTLLQKSVALLKTKENLLSALYLQYSYITNPSMYKVENASAQPNLLLSKIRETKIMLPPLFLQNDFAAFVQQIDKSKFAVQKALEKAETLYKSLMQQYFA